MGGWIVFAIVGGIVICCGFMIAVAILKAAWAQRERESLTSSDLAALEESAVILIDNLKTEIDAGIAELDARRKDVARLIDEADRRLAALERYGSITAHTEMPTILEESIDETEIDHDSELRRRKAVELAACGLGNAAEIARASGIGAAEANLMLRLAKQKRTALSS